MGERNHAIPRDAGSPVGCPGGTEHRRTGRLKCSTATPIKRCKPAHIERGAEVLRRAIRPEGRVQIEGATERRTPGGSWSPLGARTPDSGRGPNPRVPAFSAGGVIPFPATAASPRETYWAWGKAEGTPPERAARARVRPRCDPSLSRQVGWSGQPGCRPRPRVGRPRRWQRRCVVGERAGHWGRLVRPGGARWRETRGRHVQWARARPCRGFPPH